MSVLYRESSRSYNSFLDQLPRGDTYFILSNIDAGFLKKHNIKSTVSDFKKRVRKSKPFAKCSTGSVYYNFRFTPIYRISDFKWGE